MRTSNISKDFFWLVNLSATFLNMSSDYPIREQASWEEEKDDILERASWLCDKIIVKPEELINSMPPFLSEGYSGEWAIYCCSMLAHALANISYIYPEVKGKCKESVAKLIDIVNTPVIRHYDTIKWHEDALESLCRKKSHMTYISILAWMITNYMLIGGDERYGEL